MTLALRMNLIALNLFATRTRICNKNT